MHFDFFFFHISSFPESRPLSIPMKVMPDTTAEDSWTTSEERMKELIAHAWDAVKRLTLQVLNCACIQDTHFLPFIFFFTKKKNKTKKQNTTFCIVDVFFCLGHIRMY